LVKRFALIKRSPDRTAKTADGKTTQLHFNFDNACQCQTFPFWIDGAPQASLTGIKNRLYSVDRIRLGAPFMHITSTSGTFDIDACESRQQTYIGF
jgi:hypothetical protein